MSTVSLPLKSGTAASNSLKLPSKTQANIDEQEPIKHDIVPKFLHNTVDLEDLASKAFSIFGQLDRQNLEIGEGLELRQGNGLRQLIEDLEASPYTNKRIKLGSNKTVSFDLRPDSGLYSINFFQDGIVNSDFYGDRKSRKPESLKKHPLEQYASYPGDSSQQIGSFTLRTDLGLDRKVIELSRKTNTGFRSQSHQILDTFGPLEVRKKAS